MNAAYRREAAAIDRTLLHHISAWHDHGAQLNDEQFNALALRIFEHQLHYNEPYARYSATLGFNATRLPEHWKSIPAVPSGAFKEAVLTTFPADRAQLTFCTSGTTQAKAGTHYMESAALYDAVLLAGFDRAMRWDHAALRYFNLLADPAEAPFSSLAYMMGKVCRERASAPSGWYVQGDRLLFDGLLRDLHRAAASQEPVCLTGTAFAFVHMLDEFAGRRLTLQLPRHSRVMETGGFKGRSRVVSREALYERLSAFLGIPPENIVAEYGMTELTSQYYDSRSSRVAPRRVKIGPPWLRTSIPDARGGSLTHFDLANRSSVIAIGTEDIGVAAHDGFVLLGRDADAELRGCSLDAQDLQHA